MPHGPNMMILYALTLIGFFFYSYVLVDPNLTFINHPLWNQFRSMVIPIGYFQRELSWYIYLILIVLLLIFHFNILKYFNKYHPLKIAFVIGLILLLSYPFLSHDFFNYMFDAKILTFYHQNPYLQKALDFPADPWLRFLQWTHRSYPYGPVFLGLSLIPSFLSFGKFLLSFIFFKATVVLFYLLAVFFLHKLNKKWAVIFATHPLILVEGLMNGHNDLFALSLGIIGIYYLQKNKNLWARIFFVLSAGIKYFTLPIIALIKNKKLLNFFIFAIQIGIVMYYSFTSEIQPWYFLTLFIFLPYYETLLSRFNIFFAGLLFSYYPYIRFGGWDEAWKVDIKHRIIVLFLILNIIFIISQYRKLFSHIENKREREKKGK